MDIYAKYATTHGSRVGVKSNGIIQWDSLPYGIMVGDQPVWIGNVAGGAFIATDPKHASLMLPDLFRNQLDARIKYDLGEYSLQRLECFE